MRKKIVAGNWKMNTTLNEGVKLLEETLRLLSGENMRETVVIFCPPFISLEKISSMIKERKNIFSSAQNCSSEKGGAFTGEISAGMIKSVGAGYVILGHSERRQYFSETNQILAKKTDCVLDEGLKPIFCVGEPLEARDGNQYRELVEKQLKEGVFHLGSEQFQNVVIAYEPVWAIGTGKVASDDQAQEMHAFIRNLVAQKYSRQIADETSILYGGSCKPSNARGLFSQPDVDGGLIGGASLIAADFAAIINSL